MSATDRQPDDRCAGGKFLSITADRAHESDMPRLGHESLSVRIRNELVERIVSGHYRAGDRLVELRIAREFGSSQGPVREALRELETAGLVSIRPRRGTFVNDYHARAQHEIYFVRGALEEAAARLAVPRLGGDVSELSRHLEGMRDAARNADIEAAILHSVAFHRTILVAAGNDLLLNMWESLHVEMHSRKTILQPNIDLAAVAESHKPIVEAFADVDVERACRLSREHQVFFERQA